MYAGTDWPPPAMLELMKQLLPGVSGDAHAVGE